MTGGQAGLGLAGTSLPARGFNQAQVSGSLFQGLHGETACVLAVQARVMDVIGRAVWSLGRAGL